MAVDAQIVGQLQAQPGCGVAHARHINRARLANAKDDAACDNLAPTELGLVVLYDTALLESHERPEIEGWITARFQEANGIFSRSGADTLSYDLIAMREVSPPLPDSTPGDRVRIREILNAWNAQGENSVLTQLRNGYGADMVVLITTPFHDSYNGPNDICGIASRPVNGVTGLAVVEYRCGEGLEKRLPQISDYTFAHELGHTLGMTHEKGHLLDQDQKSTVMACVYDSNRPVTTGVCNRISYFSNPDIDYTRPNCRACSEPTGTLDEDNMKIACLGAPGFSQLREPDADLPPTVHASSPHSGMTLPSGSIVTVSATATDPEDGIIQHIDWIDESGAIIAQGANRQIQPFSQGRIGARVTDSAGQVDEWWLDITITTTPDAFEHDDTGSIPIINLGDSQRRNFHTANDADRVRTPRLAAGEIIRIEVQAIGNRVNPQLEIAQCSPHFGCPSYQPVDGLMFEVQADGNTFYSARVRELQGRSGLGTDYDITFDQVLESPQVFPMVGGWLNAARDGVGLDFQRTPTGEYVAIWYTYRADGTPTWYISAVAPITGMQWSAILYESTWANESNSLEIVGTLSLSFNNAVNATFSYDVNGVMGQEAYTSFNFGGGAPTGFANGMWYPPNQSGWGASIWHRGDVVILTASTYDAWGRPTWTLGVGDGDPSGLYFDMLQTGNGISLCPGCNGGVPKQVFPDVGTAWLNVNAAGSGQLALDVDYAQVPGGWDRSVHIERLTD